MILIKRIVVAGSRNYKNYEEAKAYISVCISKIKENHTLIFLSGCCKGADLLGEKFALENGYKIERHPALWEKYGRKAGPIRNKTMAEKADCVICFWDGKSFGTKSMIYYAKKFNKKIRIKYIDS